VGIKKTTIILLLVAAAAIALAACGKNNTGSAPKVFFDEKNPAKSRVVGADSAAEAANLMINKIGKRTGEKYINFQSSELPLSDAPGDNAEEFGSEYVVVSVICIKNVAADDIGPYNSDVLFSVLKKKGNTWNFIRLPDEAIRSIDSRKAFPIESGELPPVLNNSDTLTAGFELGEMLSKATPRKCQGEYKE